MNNLRRIKSIIFKDLLEALHNKTFLVVIMLPLIASLFFTVINNAQLEKEFSVGIFEEGNTDFFSFVSTGIKNFQAVAYYNSEDGKASLEKGNIDGLIIYNNDRFTVYLDSQKAMTFLFLKSSIEEVVELYMGVKPEVNLNVIPVNIPVTRWSFLPTWITITITMIGVLVLSGSIAEEKETRTLDALMVTPACKQDILLGKGGAGIILIILTISIMFLINGVILTNISQFLALSTLILSAALCFSSIGLLIGNLAGSQSAARSLGTVIYFPLLFPALVYDLTEFTRKLARLFPTFYLLKGLEKVLFYQGGIYFVGIEICILMVFAMFFFIITLVSYRGGRINA